MRASDGHDVIGPTDVTTTLHVSKRLSLSLSHPIELSRNFDAL
jgi:hypothetical protein